MKVFSFFKDKRVVLGLVFALSMSFVFVQGKNVALSDNCPGIPPQTPAFNVWPLTYDPSTTCADLALIDAKNLSSSDARDSRYASSQAEHDQGINASVGQHVRVSLYFHNGASDQIDRNQTTAHNVTLSSSFDQGASTDHAISGAISASNTPTVTSGSKGGNITIHTGSQTTLAYVPGSTFLCVNQTAIPSGLSASAGNCGVASDGTPRVLVQMPDGIANGSVNIGDVKACFPFSGTLVYEVLVQGVSTGSANLQITKSVRNVSRGETSFSPITNATQGDTVEFQINVTNTGTATANQVRISDQLPSGLNFDSSTFNNSLITSSGYLTSDLPAGQSTTATFRATVAVSSGTLTNVATAVASNASQVQAHASVVVNPVVPQNTTLSITKQVRDVANGQPTYASSVTAHQGDTVDFHIQVTNTGSITAQNVVVSDVLPSGLDFVNGTANSTLLSSNGYNIGNLGAGQSATVDFSARVSGGVGTYVNNATAHGSNTNTVSASASVTVAASSTPNVSITKGVEDLTQGQTAYVSSTNVLNGDTVQYQITVTNTGNTALSGVYVVDQLPAGLNFTTGSIGFTLGGSGSNITDHLTLPNLNPGQSATINFRAQVTATSGSLTNTATVFTNEAGQRSASATVNVTTRQATNLTITKLVRNLNQANSVFSSSTTANPGDHVAYQIQVTASNNSATNVTVLDSMPSFLTYVSGSARLNNNSTGINFIGQNANIGTINAGSTDTLYFEAAVASNMPTCQTNIVNTANASADNVGTVNASATVTVNNSCSTGFGQLRIDKLVKNLTYNGAANNGTFQKSVHAFTNDHVEFQVTITNTGTLAVNNVNFNDVLPNGLVLVNGSVREDNNGVSDAVMNNSFNAGTLAPNRQHVFIFDAIVSASAGQTLQNVAKASGDSVSQVQDFATVTVDSNVLGATVNLQLSKSAFNDTKNVDATLVPASKEDFITYTLVVRNIGNADATNYVIQDDLSNVLNYSSLVDAGGGTVNGNLLVYPATNIPAGQTVQRTFRVRVSYFLPTNGNLSLVNTFGNTVTIRLLTPQILGSEFVAPHSRSILFTSGENPGSFTET